MKPNNNKRITPRKPLLVYFTPNVLQTFAIKARTLGISQSAIINNLVMDYCKLEVMYDIDKYAKENEIIRSMLGKYALLDEKGKNKMVDDIIYLLQDSNIMNRLMTRLEELKQTV